MLPLRPAVDGDVDDAPAAPLAEPAPALDAPELAPAPMLEPPPIVAFFRMKLPPLPAAADEDAVASLVLELVLVPSARCRQPVAVTEPADSVDERPVVGCPLCGVLEVGVCDELEVGDCGVLEVGACAARAPHKATLLLSVIAHCH